MPDEPKQNGQPRQKQRQIVRQMPQQNGGSGNEMSSAESSLFDIEATVNALDERFTVLAQMLEDTRQEQNHRLSMIFDAVQSGNASSRKAVDDVQQIIRLVAIDPKALPGLRKAAEKLDAKADKRVESLASVSRMARRGGGGLGLFLLAVGICAAVFMAVIYWRV